MIKVRISRKSLEEKEFTNSQVTEIAESHDDKGLEALAKIVIQVTTKDQQKAIA